MVDIGGILYLLHKKRGVPSKKPQTFGKVSISVQLKLRVSKWPQGVRMVNEAYFSASVFLFFHIFSHYCDWEWLGLTGGVVSIVVN